MKVNTQAIAEGLYRIICERGEEHIVAFGMVPKWIIDLTERHLREKIIELAAAQNDTTAEALRPFVSEKLIQELMQPIIHDVTSGIFTAAKNAGKLVV